MRVIRGEPVEVWLRDDRPARFVWRGRMYTVIFVVDRRLITLAEPAREVSAAPPPAEPTPTAVAERADPVGAEPTEPTEPTEASLSGADGRECWLVEATPERALPPMRYELCHDLPSDRWSLSRN